MWVKICANTNLEDAAFAALHGADAVGFVFAPSSRQVTAAQVAEIVPGLPPAVERIGVFTSCDAREIAATAEQADLTAVQLHGAQGGDFLREVQALTGPTVGVIPVVHWQVEDAHAERVVSEQLELLEASGFGRVLVDAKMGSRSGGLGVAFDWSAACGVFKRFSHLQLVLAGGLTPANVGEAISTLEPWGVDVASGVEQEPGTKDRELVTAMVRNARRL